MNLSDQRVRSESRALLAAAWPGEPVDYRAFMRAWRSRERERHGRSLRRSRPR